MQWLMNHHTAMEYTRLRHTSVELVKKYRLKKNIDENGSVADAPLNFHYKKFYRLAPIMHR